MIRVGIGTRTLNFIVDTGIISLLTFGSFRTWEFYVYYWHFTFYPFYYFLAGILVVYYTFFEGIFALTPGKWLSISKVVNEKGNKPGFPRVLLRSIVRLT